MDDEDVKYYKVATQGEYDLTSLAQAYVEYRNKNTSIKFGRQIF